jgi:hypothetical protein
MRSIQRTALLTVRPAPGSGFGAFGRTCPDDNGRWLAVPSERAVILIDAAHGREVAVLALPSNHPFRFDRQEQAIWTHGNDGLLPWPIRPAGARAGEIRVGPPER